MSAPPVPYRAESNSQQYTPSFPPPVYYRDTFGLEPVEYLQGDCITDSDDESGTTKSTGYFSHLNQILWFLSSSPQFCPYFPSGAFYFLSNYRTSTIIAFQSNSSSKIRFFYHNK